MACRGGANAAGLDAASEATDSADDLVPSPDTGMNEGSSDSSQSATSVQEDGVGAAQQTVTSSCSSSIWLLLLLLIRAKAAQLFRAAAK